MALRACGIAGVTGSCAGMTSVATNGILPAADMVRTHGRLRALAPTAMAAAGFCAVWLFSLSRSLLDPIGYDQALYQYMAERVIAGQTLYVDVWDQNAPGIVGIHWLATMLVGGSPIAHRAFDAGWQLLTLAALVGLAVRDGRRWAVAWVAAGLYTLSYYGMGYVQTAQREGFAVLPLLLAAHAVLRSESGDLPAAKSFRRHVLAGAMGLLVFSIKPPLGLAFGVLWVRAVVIARQHRREGTQALAGLAGLTMGFVAAAAAATGLLWYLGSLDGCWGVLTRRDMPGYIAGPDLIRAIAPSIILSGGALAALIGLLALGGRLARGETATGPAAARSECLRTFVAGMIVLGMLMTARQWPAWRDLLTLLAGLWLPALGAILICFWRGRSETWRVCLLLLAATIGAVVIQGQYFLYHCTPIFAFVAYLSAEELGERFRRFGTATRAARVWTATCLAAVAYLAAGYWWPTMTFVGSGVNLLSDQSLAEHYTAITKHKLSCPTYETTVKVAERIQELTDESDPIACLFHEMRIYYFSKRPPVHRLLPVQPVFRHMFADYMHAIRERRPKVIVARRPGAEKNRWLSSVSAVSGEAEMAAVEAAVFDATEAHFGPEGRVIRDLYHITDIIDDVCILQPVADAAN